MRSLLICVLYFVPVLAFAQAPPLTVDDAVSQSLKNNPRLSAAARDVAAARSGVRSARSLANPEVLFTPGLQAGGSDTEFLVQQKLELNGTRTARTGIASAQLRRTQSQAVVELRDLIFDTKSAYYELTRAREQEALAADVLRATEEFDRRIRRLVEEGKRPGIELAQTGIEVTRAQQQLTIASSQAVSAVAALEALTGRPANQPIGPLAPITFTPQPIDDEAILQLALTARAEIAVEQAGAEEFRQEARLAKAEGLPDLAPQFRATSITRGLSDYGVGIGVTIPFLDYGSRRNRIRQAEESARAQVDRTAAQRNQVRQEVRRAITRLRSSEAVLQSFQQGILDRSRRLLEAARIGLQEGQASVTVLSVLEAQRTYRSVQSEYINAQVAHAQARAELERATGAVPASLLPEARK